MDEQRIILAVLVDDLGLSYPVAGPFSTIETAIQELPAVKEAAERLYPKNRFKCWHVSRRYGDFYIPMEKTLFGWERKDRQKRKGERR